jgi:hypothetical protein
MNLVLGQDKKLKRGQLDRCSEPAGLGSERRRWVGVAGTASDPTRGRWAIEQMLRRM